MAGTLTLQIRKSDESEWRDVEQYTASATEKSYTPKFSGVQLRIGFKENDYESGTAVIEIRQG